MTPLLRVEDLRVSYGAVPAVDGVDIEVHEGEIVAVLGSNGAGNRVVEGVMAVGILLGVLEALVSGYLTSSLRDIVAFIALIVVLYFRPDGLFGSYSQR
ncbi:MAG: hypothetical protein HY329_26100 [Chloroflexi bacterium]|nr:hypothetical protein [Chloroflexota bacterium]